MRMLIIYIKMINLGVLIKYVDSIRSMYGYKFFRIKIKY